MKRLLTFAIIIALFACLCWRCQASNKAHWIRVHPGAVIQKPSSLKQ